MKRIFKNKITGDIAQLKNVDSSGYMLNRNTIGLIPKEYIENSNDWEEVVEKEYQILSFSFNKANRIDTLRENGLYGISTGSNKQNTGKYGIDSYSGWEIHSVKRLSDGEVFTIGDYIDGPCGNNQEITKIDTQWIYYQSNTKTKQVYTYHLSEIKKSKKPLFTTEDGVDIYEGDNVWFVNTKSKLDPLFVAIIYNWDLAGSPNTSSDYKWLSTKKAAETYIKFNKPALSLNDIYHVFSQSDSKSKFTELVTNLVKEKL